MTVNELGEADVNAGRVSYDGRKARACLDSLAAAACTTWGGDDELTRFPPCFQILVGTAAPGAACTRSGFCANGYCDVTGADTGACVAFAGPGEPCASTGVCLPDLFCRFDASSLNGTCSARLPNGSICRLDDDCQSGDCAFPAGASSGTCGVPTVCDGV